MTPKSEDKDKVKENNIFILLEWLEVALVR